MTDTDPTITDPELYRTLWENDDVRVLEYRDVPGDETTPHAHPNTVMVTLTDFDRRLTIGGNTRDVSLTAGSAVWLPTQTHRGRNIGSTPTHTILVELKHSSTTPEPGVLGPAT
ncbi:cytoplasmic protein [Salinibacterium sp. G-O1]|uniref:cupin domain-containing protein n=1 Tax=Salinibacterium sp. G-O1 TaxID=3046208 RepID=UPI0024B93CAF|nr:cytoplasmic protein [Salinibacterium sp. G-O1]MDJ0334649.1 cytoplasmic protein [Salinibacterium sp. G-O1]